MVNTFNLSGFYSNPSTSILSSHLFSNVCIHNNPKSKWYQFGVSFWTWKGHYMCEKREHFCYVDKPCSTPFLFNLLEWVSISTIQFWGNNVIDTCNVMFVDIVNFYNHMKFFSVFGKCLILKAGNLLTLILCWLRFWSL